MLQAPLADRLTLTIPEAAVLSGLPVKIVRAAVLNDDLQSFTVGSMTKRVKRTDLDDWIRTL
ncbi:DNA-binding protein [Bifidobacterium vespertilionis]|uniref:DNA-binding protein n=2 Tax=Bifidobacterium vespertilionis TaxID=2562524 RepID=A0A5J5DYD7_9BIFI|nr:DNA-binding protein [Bifidobacterium vespertilionis]KAA8824832.1 DNA-binding protein [Bifidobacterium vespertilionis]